VIREQIRNLFKPEQESFHYDLDFKVVKKIIESEFNRKSSFLDHNNSDGIFINSNEFKISYKRSVFYGFYNNHSCYGIISNQSKGKTSVKLITKVYNLELLFGIFIFIISAIILLVKIWTSSFVEIIKMVFFMIGVPFITIKISQTRNYALIMLFKDYFDPLLKEKEQNN